MKTFLDKFNDIKSNCIQESNATIAQKQEKAEVPGRGTSVSKNFKA